jgi:dCMP deaminase
MSEHYNWLGMALACARASYDPATQVGAVIVRDKIAIASGHNRFPYTVNATRARLDDRAMKLRFMIHAERVAMLNALKNGAMLYECTLYLAATDATGEIWGGPPCANCMIELVEAGLRHIVSFPQKKVSKWSEDLALSREIITEANVRFEEIQL